MAWLLCVAGCAIGASAGAADGNGYALWPAPSVVKVFLDDTPRDVGQPVRMSAASNEYECGQVVVTAGDSALSDVSITVSPLRLGRHRIPASAVHLLLPHFITCPSENRDFPDPLPPLAEPFSVAAGTSQPVFVEVLVPKGTPAGVWRGAVTVRPANAAPAELPIELEVYPFELPDEVHVVSTFGLNMEFVYREHGAESPAARAKLDKAYYELLLAHKVSPYSLPVDLRSPEAARYLNDPRLTAFVIPFREDEQYLREIAQFLRRHGWLDKGYLYVVDEPIGKESYDRIKQVAELIHRADPDLRLIAPFYRAPDWDTSLTTFDVLTGSLDIWCPNESYFDANPRVYEQTMERKAKGEDAWCYVCCGPGPPYNNFFIQMDGFAHRLLYTQLYRIGVPGLLYWSTTYWGATDDPWSNMMTVPDINKSIYGDGSLLYPGSKVDIDGPVGSIRLKLIRDGIEDYEYLRLLAEQRGTEAALRASRRLCRSLTDYCRDADELDTIRAKIAREIGEPGRAQVQ